jgi:hypothetical protein
MGHMQAVLMIGVIFIKRDSTMGGKEIKKCKICNTIYGCSNVGAVNKG